MINKSLSFTKMHGLGNDFVIINTLHQPVDLDNLPIRQLADRHTGLGFDQLLTIEPPRQGDYFCRIFNADGSEAEQCGNGLRCIARLLHQEGLHTNASMVLETTAGLFPVLIEDDNHIRVTMGKPLIQQNGLNLQLSSVTKQPLCIISIGNPHAIANVSNLDRLEIDTIGREISSHPFFPTGVNVGFMQIIDRSHIRLRTFERGIGETHACGSNACAAAVAGILNDGLTSPVIVEYRYGNLTVGWEGGNTAIYLTGPAVVVFSGEWLS